MKARNGNAQRESATSNDVAERKPHRSRSFNIARLPREIREKLNCRLADGEPGNRLVEWLNSNPDVMTVMAEQFEGRPITEKNLSEWRAGGYEEWAILHDFLDETRVISENSGDITDTGISSDHLHIVLLAHHAHLLQNLGIMPEDEYKIRLNTVRKLTTSVMNLRRDELQKARLELQQERLEFLREKEAMKSAEAFGIGAGGGPGKSRARKAVSSTSTDRRRSEAKRPQTPMPGVPPSDPDIQPSAKSSSDETAAPSLSAPSLEAEPSVSPGFGRIHPDVSHLATHSPCHPLSTSRIQSEISDPSAELPALRDWLDSVGLGVTGPSLRSPVSALRSRVDPLGVTKPASLPGEVLAAARQEASLPGEVLAAARQEASLPGEAPKQPNPKLSRDWLDSVVSTLIDTLKLAA